MDWINSYLWFFIAAIVSAMFAASTRALLEKIVIELKQTKIEMKIGGRIRIVDLQADDKAIENALENREAEKAVDDAS